MLIVAMVSMLHLLNCCLGICTFIVAVIKQLILHIKLPKSLVG